MGSFLGRIHHKVATRMALARNYGRLEHFQPDSETITAYLERVDLYFRANDVPNDKKVSVLLNFIGAKTYTLLRNLVAPTAPADKTLAQLKQVLRKHFKPTKIVIAERFNFYHRNQREDESVADYVAELQRLSMDCDFGDFLKPALRDRLVCGLKNESAQKKLLTEANLTFTRAVEIAEGNEAAEASTQEFNKGNPASVRRMTQPCYRCGRHNHTPDECRFKDATCHVCKKKGHLANVCHQRKQGQKKPATDKQSSSSYKKKPGKFGQKLPTASL